MRSPLRAYRAAIPFVVARDNMSTMTGSSSVGHPAAIGLGVKRPSTAPCGATFGDRRVGAGEQHGEAALGREARIGGQGSHMATRRSTTVTTGCAAISSNARSSASRTSHMVGQPVAVPGEGAAVVGDNRRLALPGDHAAFDRVEMERQELQAMRGVTHEIAFHQDLRDRARPLDRHAARAQQSQCEGGQIVGGVCLRELMDLPGIGLLDSLANRIQS